MVLALAACAMFAADLARADDGALLSDDTWRYRSDGALAIDAGLIVGFPAVLPTGLSTGVGAARLSPFVSMTWA